MATIALFIALGGASYAATQLPKNSVGPKQLENEAVTPAKLSSSAKSTLTGQTGPMGAQGPKGDQGNAGLQGQQGKHGVRGKAGERGVRGEPGEQGIQGERGVQGTPGTDGSPETPSQVLEKLKQVDGEGSGLDAETVGGLKGSELLTAEGATFTNANLPIASPVDDPSLCARWDFWYSEIANPVRYYRDPLGFVHLEGTAAFCAAAGVGPSTLVFELPRGYRPEGDTGFETYEAMDVAILPTGEVTTSGPFYEDTTIRFSGVSYRCGPSGQYGCP
ncbi:MAG: hypothetical protein ACRDPE_07795 [Solirubrobacterales bacterium]